MENAEGGHAKLVVAVEGFAVAGWDFVENELLPPSTDHAEIAACH